MLKFCIICFYPLSSVLLILKFPFFLKLIACSVILNVMEKAYGDLIEKLVQINQEQR